MLNLYIVRHVQSMGNIEKFIQGQFDADITPYGKEQLIDISHFFSSIEIDTIFSSSLKRAKITADAIKNNRNIPFIIDDRVIEIDVGIWQQKSFEFIEMHYKNDYDVWRNTPWDFKVKNSESMIDVYNRTKQFAQFLIKEYMNKTIVVISHGCTVRNLICNFLGYDIKRIIDFDYVDNASITNLFISENEKNLNYINKSCSNVR